MRLQARSPLLVNARVAAAQAADARARARRAPGRDGVADEVAAHVVERLGDRVDGLDRAAAPGHARELRRRDRRAGRTRLLRRRARPTALAGEERGRPRPCRTSERSLPSTEWPVCGIATTVRAGDLRRRPPGRPRAACAGRAWPSRTSVGTCGSGPGARRRRRGDGPADAQRDQLAAQRDAAVERPQRLARQRARPPRPPARARVGGPALRSHGNSVSSQRVVDEQRVADPRRSPPAAR